MTLLDGLRSAFQALTVNKLRSGLTTLGIVIGIASVIALMGIGQGAQASVLRQIEGMGSNLIFVVPGQTSDRPGSRVVLPTLTLEDAYALARAPELADLVAGVAPQTNTRAVALTRDGSLPVEVQGVTPEFEWVRNRRVEWGRFLTQQEVQARAHVAVIGSRVAEELFPGIDPLGQTLRLNRWTFRVIGVLEEVGGSAFGSRDDVVLVPITTLQARLEARRSLGGQPLVDLISVQAVSPRAVEPAQTAISEILRRRHRVLEGEEDFSITSQQDILRQVQEVTGVFTIFLGSIAGISLLVGGIGIMNIMLVSVAERTREIGIRKAVGARRRDILLQFLLESAMLGMVGGVVGILAGIGLARGVTGLPLGTVTLETRVSPGVVLLAVGVSLAVGLFFGLYPAFRASSLDPIQALRHE